MDCFVGLVVGIVVDLDRLDDGRVVFHVAVSVVRNLVNEREEGLVQALPSTGQTDYSSLVDDHRAAVDLRARKSGHIDKPHADSTEHLGKRSEVLWCLRNTGQCGSDRFKCLARVRPFRSLFSRSVADHVQPRGLERRQ